MASYLKEEYKVQAINGVLEQIMEFMEANMAELMAGQATTNQLLQPLLNIKPQS